MLYQHCVASYLQECEHLRAHSPYTLRANRAVLKYLQASAGKDLLEEYPTDQIREFLCRGRIERNWCSGTVRDYWSRVHSFFDWCVKRSYLRENPSDGIELPRLERTIPARLSQQSALRMLEVARNYPWRSAFVATRNHAMLATMLYAGLRCMEVLHLTVTDLDMDNRTLLVRRGKGAKDRLIPMTDALADSLAGYATQRRRIRRTCPEFFTAEAANRGLEYTALKRVTRLMQDVMRMPVRPHLLRHTFATLMLEGGCDLFSLSKLMGHTDIKTTTLYLAASATHLRAQILKHPLGLAQQ